METFFFRLVPPSCELGQSCYYRDKVFGRFGSERAFLFLKTYKVIYKKEMFEAVILSAFTSVSKKICIPRLP